MFEKILYPTDCSEISLKAVDYIKNMRGAGVRKVVLLMVISRKCRDYVAKGIALAGKDVAAFLQQACEVLSDEALKELKPVEGELRAAGFDVKVRVEEGVPATKILEVAESENVSAIVLGSHGRSNVAAALLGSVSDHVIRHSKIPVLVIKRD